MTMPETLWLTTKKISELEETESSSLGLFSYLNFYPTRKQAREDVRDYRIGQYLTPIQYRLATTSPEFECTQYSNWVEFQVLPAKIWLNFDYDNGDFCRYLHDKSKTYYGYAKWSLCQIDSRVFYNKALYNPDEYVKFSEPYLYIRT